MRSYGMEICKRCGAEMVKRAAKQLYCSECKKVIRKEYNQAYIEKHKTGNGLMDKPCKNCGKIIHNATRAQKWCDECRAIMTRKQSAISRQKLREKRRIQAQQKLLRTNREAIIAFNEEAREHHMSYGQWQAMMRIEANRA